MLIANCLNLEQILVMDHTDKLIEQYVRKYPNSSMGSISYRIEWLKKRIKADEEKRLSQKQAKEWYIFKDGTDEHPYGDEEDEEDSVQLPWERATDWSDSYYLGDYANSFNPYTDEFED